MDLEQEELQFLGQFGIYRETCKLIYRLRKILAQITLTLILPLAFILLAEERISAILYWKIRFNEFRLEYTESGTPRHDKLSDLVSTEWAEYVLLKLAYYVVVLIFSLLSTSAVVYTVACAYTAREITFRKVISVVPRVWKRLIVTFLCAFFAFFMYNLGFGLTLFVWSHTIADSTAGVVVLIVILILYSVVFIYLTIIWQLASVVSVLEDSYGIKAMLKSKRLIRGKMMTATFIFFMLNVLIFFTDIFFKVFGFRSGLGPTFGFGAVSLFVLMVVMLFGLVVQTVVYLVCKSYHHENIDKSALSDHLEVYLGDYVPLMAKDVQLGDLDRV